jgi:hypothetical protein
MESAVRTCRRPPQMARVPRQVPLSRVSGARPTRAATCWPEPWPSAGRWASKVGEQGKRDGRPDARHTAQELVAFAPQRAGAQGLVQLPIQLLESLLQPGDVRGDLGAYGRACLPQAVLLGGQHAQHLLATREEGCEGLTLCVGQRSWRGLTGAWRSRAPGGD